MRNFKKTSILSLTMAVIVAAPLLASSVPAENEADHEDMRTPPQETLTSEREAAPSEAEIFEARHKAQTQEFIEFKDVLKHFQKQTLELFQQHKVPELKKFDSDMNTIFLQASSNILVQPHLDTLLHDKQKEENNKRLFLYHFLLLVPNFTKTLEKTEEELEERILELRGKIEQVRKIRSKLHNLGQFTGQFIVQDITSLLSSLGVENSSNLHAADNQFRTHSDGPSQ